MEDKPTPEITPEIAQEDVVRDLEKGSESLYDAWCLNEQRKLDEITDPIEGDVGRIRFALLQATILAEAGLKERAGSALEDVFDAAGMRGQYRLCATIQELAASLGLTGDSN